MSKIHEKALVDPAANIADDVEIGPSASSVRMSPLAPVAGSDPHVVLTGRTTLGKNNTDLSICLDG